MPSYHGRTVGTWVTDETRLLHRGYYMSAHVLLNLLNESRKSDKMRALMLDSIYHMTLRLL